ncbi:MAG: hypothetical protein KBA31_07910 [Alphaproteobacteria bacterium]|nr:hypothetical protein [Alphaproteobacteria bacterium]
MSEPEWMNGFVPTPTGPMGRWVKGQSGNPKGRRPGIIDKRTKVTQSLMDDAPAVARVVINAALDGDVQAAALVLSRVAPPIKAQAERVQFELSKDAPLSDQAQQILQAVADGKVDPETGRTLIGCIQSVAGIQAIENLEQRIITLEEKAA